MILLPDQLHTRYTPRTTLSQMQEAIKVTCGAPNEIAKPPPARDAMFPVMLLFSTTTLALAITTRPAPGQTVLPGMFPTIDAFIVTCASPVPAINTALAVLLATKLDCKGTQLLPATQRMFCTPCTPSLSDDRSLYLHNTQQATGQHPASNSFCRRTRHTLG